MKKTLAVTICLLLFTCAALSQQEPGSASRAVVARDGVEERHFRFHYDFTVRNTNPGKRLRVWIPLAHTDSHQVVRVVSISGDLPLKKTHESEYGNEILYASTAKADRAEYKFSVEYDVVRREDVRLRDGRLWSAAMRAKPASLARFLQPDRLVPMTGLPAEWAAREVQGRSGDLDRGRALYDFVMRTMRYDKTGTGWGRGDVAYACDAKKGNCTDFHSLFIAMSRSQRIPAKFEIGFQIPPAKRAGEVTGYHCWAEFYSREAGWIPVDISEGWKAPARRDYYFGSHDADRIQFTVGRDLRLSPAQDGAPLNYFLYPYVELDGKEYSNVATAFAFEDVVGAMQSATAGGN
jgi:transglutaminase-like putative cysteine protease